MKKIPSNEIWYTTIDNKVLKNFNKKSFDAELCSNLYHEKGILRFKAPISVIGEYAFDFCKELKEIFLPDSIIKIESQAFFNCHNLRSVDLPKSVKYIQDSSFGNCITLEQINLPNDMKELGNYAFENCENLKKIEFPNRPNRIGVGVFSGCHKIENLNTYMSIGDGKSIIDGEVFINYIGGKSIKEYRIPEGIVEIAKEAFCSNNNIEIVHIPKSVKVIRSCAFILCPKLKVIEFYSENPPQFENNAFKYNCRGMAVHVPSKTVERYRDAFLKTEENILVIDKQNIEHFYNNIIQNPEHDFSVSLECLHIIGLKLYCDDKDELSGIKVFEKLVKYKYKDLQPYTILIEHYKKKRYIEDEIRLLGILIERFNTDKHRSLIDELQRRYNKLQNHKTFPKLPTVAPKIYVNIKHGELYEKKILEFPEYNFSKIGYFKNYNEQEIACQPIQELNVYFKNLITKAQLAESVKDYVTAVEIYEQIVAEKYWKPEPYDRLIIIYSKAKLFDEEKRVLKLSIKHFSNLRRSRLNYLEQLAEKYNAFELLEEDLSKPSGILHHYIIELYNPFHIVEKWISRLEKKNIQKE